MCGSSDERRVEQVVGFVLNASRVDLMQGKGRRGCGVKAADRRLGVIEEGIMR